MTSMRAGKRTVIVCDSALAVARTSPTSATRWSPTTELLEAFAGREVDANVLFVDQWGVWITRDMPRCAMTTAA